MFLFFFFFFSSRRRHTRCSRDWSSDVCSSDLDHLVLDLLLDGEDPVDVDAERADARHDAGGNPAPARVGLAHRDLHPEPRLVLRGLAPDTSHGGPGVPLDHGLTLLEKPDKW